MQGGAPQVLNGFVWWFVVGVYVLALLLAAFTVFDSLQSTRRARLDEIRESRWLYTGLQAFYLVIALAVWLPLPAAWRWIAAVPVLVTPIALVQQVVYLLRVVFPKPVAAQREAAGGAELHAEPPVDPSAKPPL